MGKWNGVRPRGPKQSTPIEPDLLDAMITSLAELLEEKGLITEEEWEQRINYDRLNLT